MAAILDPKTTVVQEDPLARDLRTDFLASARQLAGTRTPIAKLGVAGIDPLEQQAIDLTGGLGDFRNYLTSAQDMFSPTAFQQFQDPYEDAVVQRTISDAMDADAMRGIADRARQVSSGAFGSERGRLMEGERTRQFARGLGETLAGIRSKGFAQSNRLAQQAGTNFLNIGNQLQRQQLAQMGGLQGLGGLRRGIEQQRQASIFDAANRAAIEPQQRLTNYGNLLTNLMPKNVSTTEYSTIAGPSAAEGLNQLFRGYGPRLFGAQQGGFGQTLSNFGQGINSLFNMFNKRPAIDFSNPALSTAPMGISSLSSSVPTSMFTPFNPNTAVGPIFGQQAPNPFAAAPAISFNPPSSNLDLSSLPGPIFGTP